MILWGRTVAYNRYSSLTKQSTMFASSMNFITWDKTIITWTPPKMASVEKIRYPPKFSITDIADDDYGNSKTPSGNDVTASSSCLWRLSKKGSGKGELQWPTDIDFDEYSGQLCVSDYGNERVVILDRGGETSAEIRLKDMRPFGVGASMDGLFVVTDQAQKCVHCFHPDGTLAVTMGEGMYEVGRKDLRLYLSRFLSQTIKL